MTHAAAPATDAFRARAQPVPALALAWGLALSDLVGLLLFLDLAAWARLGTFSWLWSWQTVIVAAVVLVVSYVSDLYAVDTESLPRGVARVIAGTLISGVVLAVVVYLTAGWEDLGPLGRVVLAVSLAAFIWWAATTRWALATWLRRRGGAIEWLVVGSAGAATDYLQRVLGTAPAQGRIALLVPADEATSAASPAGTWDDLPTLLPRRWSGIVLANERALPEPTLELLLHARMGGMRVYDLTDFVERFRGRVPCQRLRAQWLTLAGGFDLLHSRQGLRIKRLMDIALSLAVLAASSPLLIAAALLVRVDSRGPALFRQVRVGRRGQPFTILKPRTMRLDAEAGGAQWAAKRDPRVTRVGRLLRATRVDELPQLWNILRGDMSFIGPRPERPEFVAELERQIPFYALRHLVKPGLTGWAQVCFPYGASVADAAEKLEYDLYYIKNYSLWLDLTIVARTVRVVIYGAGAR